MLVQRFLPEWTYFNLPSRKSRIHAIMLLTLMIGLLPMTSLSAPVMILEPLKAQPQDNERAELTVANWAFQVIGAAKAPTFADVIHLGLLEDGRSWLVVSLIATNTSDERQRIHSDDVQLAVSGERIKQTGKESEVAAAQIGYRSIGGSAPHRIDAGKTLHVLQVFKVDPEADNHTLEFDFSGKWDVSLDPLLDAANGSGLVLVGDDAAADLESPAPWMVRVPEFEFSILGAAVAESFRGPFHLGRLDDGRHWLVVSYRVRNVTDSKGKVEADSNQLLSGGEAIKHAGDETRSVAQELGIAAPTQDLDGQTEVTLVQVFKIEPGESENLLRLDYSGFWFVDLSPLIGAAEGTAEAVDPRTAEALSDLLPATTDTSAQVMPTPRPTATPLPTPTPAPTAPPTPTPVPELGTEERPAGIGDTVVINERAITLQEVYVTSTLGGFTAPKGGYVFVVFSVTIQNVSDTGSSHMHWVSYFSGKDVERDWDFNESSTWLADQPLRTGELSPGEYTYGQVVLEVHQDTEVLRIIYQPSLWRGETANWLVRL